MSAVVIDETCACGAELHWRGDSIHASKTTHDWRSEHRHIEPAAVGICGNAVPIPGPIPETGICDLLAGHAGWHEVRDGSMRWGHLRFQPRTPESEGGHG